VNLSEQGLRKLDDSDLGVVLSFAFAKEKLVKENAALRDALQAAAQITQPTLRISDMLTPQLKIDGRMIKDPRVSLDAALAGVTLSVDDGANPEFWLKVDASTGWLVDALERVAAQHPTRRVQSLYLLSLLRAELSQ